jgi:hypothetical protein
MLDASIKAKTVGAGARVASRYGYISCSSPYSAKLCSSLRLRLRNSGSSAPNPPPPPRYAKPSVHYILSDFMRLEFSRRDYDARRT